MKESISIARDNLNSVLDNFRSKGKTEVSTIEIIEAYMGGFHQNRRIAPSTSWNAQFGKYLKSNSAALNIEESSSKQKLTVNGSQTTTSFWRLIASNL